MMKHTDDFWTEHSRLFDGTFAYFDRSGKRKTPVWGKYHVSEEHYSDATHELIPLSVTRGTRVYVMLRPYVLQPKLIMTVGLYKEPKQYADADSAIGKTLGTHQEGMQRLRVGEAFVRLPDDTVRRVTTPTLPTVPVPRQRLTAVQEYYRLFTIERGSRGRDTNPSLT